VSLSAARAALLLLDAGLKTALVRRADALAAGAERRLQRQMALAAGLVVVLLLAGAALAVARGWLSEGTAWLLVASVAAYLGSHAALLPGLVRLERQGRFGAVGRAEAAGTLLEFVAPALLLALGVATLPALAVGVLAGRALRAVLVATAARGVLIDTAMRTQAGTGLWRESLPLQGVVLLSMVRDTLHLWLLAPWFGAAWAGAYAFALMAGMLASQIVVGALARVALPALRPLSPRQRLRWAVRSLRRLGWIVLPPLALLAPAVAAVDGLWLQGRWHDATTVLPWLVVRMVVALPLAVFGPWLLVAAAPAASLRVHARWTLGETAAAVAALALAGPIGLAWVWAGGALLGLGLYAQALRAAGVDLSLWAGLLLRRRGRRRPTPAAMALKES
jgi:Polysaccharide biosynthesis protein